MNFFKIVGVFVFMFISLFLFYDYIGDEQLDFLRFEVGSENNGVIKPVFPIGQLILSALVMVAGIFFGSIYDAIKSKGDDEVINFVKAAASAMKRKRFLKAMLASPIIFIIVYMAAKTQPDQIIATLLAFQNGFFCDALMKTENE